MSFIDIDAGLSGAYEQLRNGTAFNRSFENVVGGMSTQINSITSRLNTLPTSINGVAGNILSRARGIESQVTGAASRIPAFASHITGQFNNLANNISTFASAQGLRNALAGRSGGCNDLGRFFGSITSEGPRLMSEVSTMVGQVNNEIDRLANLGQTLQTTITTTRADILTQLDAEIASVVNDAGRLSNLQALRQTVMNEFNSGVGTARSALAAQVEGVLSSQRAAALGPVLNQMRSLDLDIQSVAGTIEGLGSQIDQQTGLLQGLIDGETNALQSAVSELETLGAAMGLRSLLNMNPCIQTLMGFVGTDSFLSNLRG